ncbi:MAG: hypothetical protein IJ165_03110 [Proteobacteria bacterium]|nr:hypothetical protein [Pseudomonadota bacterium]
MLALFSKKVIGRLFLGIFFERLPHIRKGSDCGAVKKNLTCKMLFSIHKHTSDNSGLSEKEKSDGKRSERKERAE